MKRFALAAALILIPLAVFAQAAAPWHGPWGAEKRALQKMGLTDAQVAQVLDIQGRTRDTLRQDEAQLRILQAQIEKAMLANPVDLQAVNALVDQGEQVRAAMRKALLAARAQLQQIMGIDNFQRYTRGMGQALAHRFREYWGWM